jgi:hypothetical protein
MAYKSFYAYQLKKDPKRQRYARLQDKATPWERQEDEKEK